MFSHLFFFPQLHSQFGCLLRSFLNTLQTLLLEAGNFLTTLSFYYYYYDFNDSYFSSCCHCRCMTWLILHPKLTGGCPIRKDGRESTSLHSDQGENNLGSQAWGRSPLLLYRQWKGGREARSASAQKWGGTRVGTHHSFPFIQITICLLHQKNIINCLSSALQLHWDFALVLLEKGENAKGWNSQHERLWKVEQMESDPKPSHCSHQIKLFSPPSIPPSSFFFSLCWWRTKETGKEGNGEAIGSTPQELLCIAPLSWWSCYGLMSTATGPLCPSLNSPLPVKLIGKQAEAFWRWMSVQWEPLHPPPLMMSMLPSSTAATRLTGGLTGCFLRLQQIQPSKKPSAWKQDRSISAFIVGGLLLLFFSTFCFVFSPKWSSSW